MLPQVHPLRAQITYRATVSGGRDAVVHFVADPAQATVADAWRRLSALDAEVDPTSLEIEIRELQPASAPQGE